MYYRGAPQEILDAARAEANKIKPLGKAAIIELANQRLSCSRPDLQFSPSDYHITVQANAFEVQVKYRSYVRYYPARLKGEELDYDLSVDLIASKIEPFDSVFFRGNFFVATEEDRKNIRFAAGDIVPQLADYTMYIVEHEKHYGVTNENRNGYGFFQWETVKATGERIKKPTLSAIPVPPPYIDQPPSALDSYQWVPIYD